MIKDSDGPTDFGLLLEKRRTKLGLTLQNVADRACCSKAHVWALEQGITRNPTVCLLASLAEALQISPMKLFRAASPAPTKGQP